MDGASEPSRRKAIRPPRTSTSRPSVGKVPRMYTCPAEGGGAVPGGAHSSRADERTRRAFSGADSGSDLGDQGDQLRDDWGYPCE